MERTSRLMRWPEFAVVIVLALVAVSTRMAGQGSSGQPTQVTFTKDIAPILQRSCQNCHRPGSVAPMSLLTYEETRPWAKAIKHRTSLVGRPEVMPPWFIDRTIGIQKYKDDMSLGDAEIAKIAAWVDAGAPRGSDADMPPAVTFADAREWRLGKPDLVVSSPAVDMPALSSDWWGPLGAAPTGLTEDRYVQSVEVKEVTDSVQATEGASARRTVGGQAVIHHLAYGLLGGDGKPTSDGGAMWPVHEVGRNPDVFDPEAGKLIPAGAQIGFFSAHLHANGRATKAHVEMGFRFFPKGYQPTRKFVDLHITTSTIDIKGMEADQKLEAYTVLKENVKIMIFEPHLHAAGVRQCVDAIWGAYTRETLTCAGYNHGWVRVYNYADDVQPLLPKGTILRMTSYFDTTPANKNVADPRNWSGLGHRSIDQMATSVVTGIPLSDEEFQQEMAKRRERLHLAPGQAVLGCPLCGYEEKKPTTAVASR